MSSPRSRVAVAAVVAAWTGLFYALGGAIDDPEGDARNRLVDDVRPVGVVLGNSITRTDVDPLALSRALPGQPSVVMLTIDGSGPSTWAELLQEHVLVRGHRPKWVLVVTDPAYAVGMAPELAHGVVHRRTTGAAERVAAGRERARGVALREWRWAAARALAAAKGTSPARASASLSSALHHWLEDPAHLREDAVPAPSGTPDLGPWRALAETVGAGGGHLLVVEAPRRTPLPPEARRAFHEIAGVVPMAPGVEDLAWIDSTHLAPEGQQRFTQALAAALVDRLP